MTPLYWSLTQTDLPGFPEVLEELFNPPAADLARYLGVHRRTVQRWIRCGHAPRAVVMALHRVSRPGLHQMHSAILRDLRATYDLNLSQGREIERLQRELARVLAAADFGSANAPSFTAPTAAELIAQRPAARVSPWL